jgi:hypothetical protein
LLATALCRWAARQGHDLAPFKAQNMSNHARVTPHIDINKADLSDGHSGSRVLRRRTLTIGFDARAADADIFLRAVRQLLQQPLGHSLGKAPAGAATSLHAAVVRTSAKRAAFSTHAIARDGNTSACVAPLRLMSRLVGS